MNKIVVVLLLGMAMVIYGCASSETATGTVTEEQGANEEIGSTAEYGDQVMEILGGSIDGDVLSVQVRFTNNSSDGMYAFESFAVKAFQNNEGLEDVTDVNDDPSGAELIKEVKDGASVEGEYKFLVSGDGDIEFQICTPTAEQEILAKMVFSK